MHVHIYTQGNNYIKLTITPVTNYKSTTCKARQFWQMQQFWTGEGIFRLMHILKVSIFLNNKYTCLFANIPIVALLSNINNNCKYSILNQVIAKQIEVN